VKSVVGGVTTYYVGNHYEVKNGTVSKYYFAGATRLAVRTGTTLSYLLSDHLGSSSVTTDANGVKTASALYKAFGETRYTLGNLGTDYKFTGQRLQAELGIYWFNSRWMDPSLGRFTQPDTIVPTSTQGTQAWDRYAFVNNNPVRYNDPTGHYVAGDCDPSRNANCDVQKEENEANGEGDNIWCPPSEQDCTVHEFGYATEDDLQYIDQLLSDAIDALIVAALLAGLAGQGKLAAYDAFEIRQLTDLRNFFAEADRLREDSPTGEIAMSVYSGKSTGGALAIQYTTFDSNGERDGAAFLPISPLTTIFISLLQGRGDRPLPFSAPFVIPTPTNTPTP
jgi:RHS repeat-associated protein